MYIKIISNGCPICGSDIRGSYVKGYLCPKCNIVFQQRSIKASGISGIVTDRERIRQRMQSRHPELLKSKGN